MQIMLWPDPCVPQRTSPRSRLAFALLISTVLHALILVLLRIEFSVPGSHDTQPVLDITLLKAVAESKRSTGEAIESDDRTSGPTGAPVASVNPQAQASEPAPATYASTDEAQPSVDWQERMRRAVHETVALDEEQKRRDAEAWRRTHSVMFTPPPEIVDVDEPYLPDLVIDDRRFKGIGFKIGENCYFGIPASPPRNVDSDSSSLPNIGAPRTGGGILNCAF